MTTYEGPPFVMSGLVSIAYRLSQARVSLTAPATQSGVQQSLSDRRRFGSEPSKSERGCLSIVLKVSNVRPQTIGEVRASGYKRETVKQEMRRNLLTRLRSGEPLLDGIVGYDDTVLPQLANAVISGHDVILLGERGQANSRIMRSLVSLLDPHLPGIAGCEINDHPYAPICRRCLDLVAPEGDNVEVEGIDRDRRYREKLATPDIPIPHLIGEGDPSKGAEGPHRPDELRTHQRLLPRT